MKANLKAPKIRYKMSLAKLDGNVTEVVADPKSDPRTDEIREWIVGEPNKIVYKRGE